ncbi:hypothetical protein D1B31_09460 [Neobacillus notoginsengisoli]|uniref:Uncharacterized protein n=1 Tax=Neobacillus notoginsengisoli TaxID=1578198 RepID=A0A417YVB4_9BACI|nr:hypothetical protein [Neobacillus notoginsengisoli]RHW41152.1 hypothetical protein D1B31_09460 [Neobacillus notoginsengisoli]
MEFLILTGILLFIMGSLVLLVSGLITFFFSKVHFLYILAGSATVGAAVGMFYGFGGFTVVAVVVNIILSSIAIGLAKYGLYLKAKTDIEPESLLS